MQHMEPIKIGYYPLKFGSLRLSDNGDIMVSVCHVILQDHEMKWSSDFIDRSPSR